MEQSKGSVIEHKFKINEVISAETAATYFKQIPDIKGPVNWFLNAYFAIVDLNTVKGVVMDNSSCRFMRDSTYFLLGQLHSLVSDTSIEEIELVLKGTYCADYFLNTANDRQLQLGLNSGWSLSKFKIREPNPHPLLEKLLQEISSLQFPPKQFRKLFAKDYGARIYIGGKIYNPDIKIQITDTKLTGLAESIFNSINEYKTVGEHQKQNELSGISENKRKNVFVIKNNQLTSLDDNSLRRAQDILNRAGRALRSAKSRLEQLS